MGFGAVPTYGALGVVVSMLGTHLLVLSALVSSLTLADSSAVAEGEPTEPSPQCFGRVATIVGTAGNDHLIGTPSADVIVGAGGDDTLRGRGGDDFLCANRVSDPEFGPDSGLYGGRGDDHLGGHRYLVGGQGDDVLQDRVPGAFVLPGPGDDVLRLGDDSSLYLADARHPLVIDLRRNTVRGQGRDVLITSGVLSVAMSRFDDVFVGDNHKNDVVGDAGDDVFRGRGGPDYFEGGNGRDTAFGGEGRDACWAEARHSCRPRF